MYTLLIGKNALKDIKKIPQKDKEKIIFRIKGLITHPFHANQLKGLLKGLYKLKVWPYRVIFTINNKANTIHIIYIGHRKDIYKRIK
jgi:mRNA interferase RelE/StbE